MQHKYVGDIGDFGKFQLFRYFFEDTQSPFYGKSLAQIWFLHDGKNERNRDGRFIDYFERMGGSDAYLEHSMMQLLMEEKRHVEELERLRLLRHARFFYEPVPYNSEDRFEWLHRALLFASHSDCVAVAPDNGMALKCLRDKSLFEPLNVREHFKQKVYPHKYIFFDEIDSFYTLPHNELLIVYQHLGRCMSHALQAEKLLALLRARYRYVVAVKHKPYSPRLFFFISKNAVIEESVAYRLRRFTDRYAEFWEALF